MYRGHAGVTGNYGPQYSSLYGGTAASLSNSEQVSGISRKGSMGVSEGHGSYKEGLLASENLSDYSSLDIRQYLDRLGAYLGRRDLPIDTAPTYSDSVSYGRRRQTEIYDRLDQSVLREQMLKTQSSLQSASEDGVGRQVDYLATRSASVRHPIQELNPCMRRLDSDSHGLATYGGQRTSSILGTVSQRNVDAMYPQSAADPGYGGVSLPPGRDYGLGKGLTPTKDVPGSSIYSRMDDWIAERTAILRDLDLRDELHEREKGRERARMREPERERERDRDRERERDGDREHERERDRKHFSNLPERERDRDHRRPLEVKHSRTMHRDSPRPGIKEKMREYVCKISASGLTMEERSFLSIIKRYPRLNVSPDFSKLVVNWPRVDSKLAFHTPVSFEHDDYIKEGRPAAADKMGHSLKQQPGTETTKNAEPRNTIWNAKMILMSGLSRRALEELSSDKVSDNHIPHICSSLRFAILKKDRSLMAIGGRWNHIIDGGDPATNNSSLVQTLLRCAKDMIGLDLQNCQHWNRFLEIHYDRVGEDGLFSHKEITVLFVPDLSYCLPSLDAWREQWLAHKKARERQIQTKRNKEKSREKVDIVKDCRDGDSSKDGRISMRKLSMSKTGSKLTGDLQPGKDHAVYLQKESELGLKRKISQLKKNDIIELAGELKDVKKKQVNNASSHDSPKLGKKKEVVRRRIIKHSGPGDSDKVDEKAGDDKTIKSDRHKDTGMKVSMADEHQKISSNIKLSDNTRNKEKLEITVKEKNHKDGNGVQRSISKDVEKRKSVEPPRHPGFILHPKGGKGSRLSSLSLSLDSLLDYTVKDVEEGTFEVSLFAEILHEMLQYQMGSRLLQYLEKLRVQFVMKRNQKKRAREESSRRDRKKDESNKRSKVEPKLSKSNSNKESQNADENSVAKTKKSRIKRDDEKLAAREDVEKSKLYDQEANQAEMDEDPEEDEDLDENEDPDENEEIQDGSPVEPNAEGEIDKEKRYVKDDGAKEKARKKKEAAVDKDLLQAFRFFDRNCVGYVRLEDMRTILHNLECLSDRAVKELAKSAFLESNNGSDDRILYEKLVRMSGLGDRTEEETFL